MDDIEFLPDISEYLEKVRDNGTVTTKGLEEIVYKIRAFTGLPKEACDNILRILFQEIRNNVLAGRTTYLSDLGKFSLQVDKRVAVRFKAVRSLVRRL